MSKHYLTADCDTSRPSYSESEDLYEYARQQADLIQNLNRIGTALSSEHNLGKLLEMILTQARLCTNADAGTLYLITDDESQLEFTVVQNDSLGIKMGGTNGEITWNPLNLYRNDGNRNTEMVAVLCALTGEVINIEDVYHAEGFDFEGAKKFDRKTGYRSISMLVIPMKNHEQEVIGVCQLLNRIDPINRDVIPFSRENEQSALSLASQAAVAISNARLINDLQELLEAIIRSIAAVIDAKSAYTGGHVRKVAELTMLIANAISTDTEGCYRDVNYNADQLKELRIAALMHDVGKIATPEYVIDKSTKLETIVDRIESVRTRAEVIKRDLLIDFMTRKAELTAAGDEVGIAALENEHDRAMEALNADLGFLETANLGGEHMSDDSIQRIHRIAGRTWTEQGKKKPLLSEDEVLNLTTRKGTLSNSERQIINDHARMSVKMLSELPFPKKLRRIPEIAGSHHEKLNGTGYPRGLCGDDLTLESRILALADIFEALSASDRPYRKPKSLKEVTAIINIMVKNGELDANLVRFFFEKSLHLEYGKKELKPEQIG